MTLKHYYYHYKPKETATENCKHALSIIAEN